MDGSRLKNLEHVAVRKIKIRSFENNTSTQINYRKMIEFVDKANREASKAVCELPLLVLKTSTVFI